MTNNFIVDKIFNKCQTFSGTHFPSSGQNRQNKCLKCTVQRNVFTMFSYTTVIYTQLYVLK